MPAYVHINLRITDPARQAALAPRFQAALHAAGGRILHFGPVVEVLEGEGTGPEHHGLSNSSRLVAGWCHGDAPTDAMVRKAREGLKG